MKVGASTLRVLLENNVLEIKFKRRRPKQGSPDTRRMLCTNSPVILQSDAGRGTLHYKPSNTTPKYSPASKNLVIAWDIFKQDYRAISVDNCELISQMPVSGDGSDFWEYFNNTIHPMTPGEKQSFFNV
jgi:hypothetical protein